MSKKGAWIAIFCILVIGLSVTWVTSCFVREQSGFSRRDAVYAAREEEMASISLSLEESGEASPKAGRSMMESPDGGNGQPGQAAALAGALQNEQPAFSGSEAGNGARAEESPRSGTGEEDGGYAAVKEKAADGSQAASGEAGQQVPESVSRSVSPSAVVISDQAAIPAEDAPKAADVPESETPVRSPLEITAAAESVNPVPEETYSFNELLERLERVSSQAEQYRKDNKGADASASYMNAEYERNLWDSELNTIYRSIRRKMDGEEAEKLKQEELRWLTERDRASEKAAANVNGQIAQSTAYSSTASAKTEARCYELLKDYGEILKRESAPEPAAESSGFQIPTGPTK